MLSVNIKMILLRIALISASLATAFTILDEIGRGSYGIVHKIQLKDKILIGKRPWNSFDGQHADEKRCDYFHRVEKHCYEKLKPHWGLSKYVGSQKDDDQREWILFDNPTTAPSLQDTMEQDKVDHRKNQQHHLYYLSQALGCQDLLETLDRVMLECLEILSHVHEQQIVHRDVKPSNFLVCNQKLMLIDFGSAADIETAGVFGKNIGIDNEKAAISPIYAAPETFIDVNKRPLNFDTFSVGLLYCQLLFQYLDERTDAGFHQQLAKCEWNLDTWLQQTLRSKVRPSSLEDALEVLQHRPGLWNLLQDMLAEDPRDRSSTKEALNRFRQVCKGEVSPKKDGLFLRDVLESFELCEIEEPELIQAMHFVATFRRSESLGLILAEKDAELDEMTKDELDEWNTVVKDASDGQVFVQGVVEGSQADELGIFRVGDRLGAVGELPVGSSGFEHAVELIGDQPRSSQYVTLYFDRLKQSAQLVSESPVDENIKTRIRDQGAWSMKGRRSAQEDAVILHSFDIGQGKKSIHLGGVCDGHLGQAASAWISTKLPSVMQSLLVEEELSLSDTFRTSWEQVCRKYRDKCTDDSCLADYDAKEGVLNAQFGADNAVAGSTASLFCLGPDGLIVLNCGDSRTVVANKNDILLETKDHKPQYELDRFEEDDKLSMPECRFNRWSVPVGDFSYALSRSLEGPFATSCGIISDPDIYQVDNHQSLLVISASDGIWDVMSPGEVVKVVRENLIDLPAREAAKALCHAAYEKGSSDNLSVVILQTERGCTGRWLPPPRGVFIPIAALVNLIDLPAREAAKAFCHATYEKGPLDDLKIVISQPERPERE